MEINELIEVRRELHLHPELGFEEFETQKIILNYISKLKSRNLELKIWRTGIIAKIKGTEPKKTIAYRADIDGLSIQEETKIEYSSLHKGKMHACGHDVHTTIALGVLTYFLENPPRENILVIFQPAEEEPGGAELMIKSKEFKEWFPDEIYAIHVAPELPIGVISTKSGVLFANTQEINIEMNGKGGHVAFPQHANDMTIALSQFIMQVQTIVSRNINPLDSVVIAFGKIQSGTARNIISQTATAEGTIRTFSQENMNLSKKRIEEIAEGIGKSFSCEVSVNWGSSYKQVLNNEELFKEFEKWVIDKDEITFQKAHEVMTGEDFGYFLSEIPGIMFWLGVDSPYPLHHAKFLPKEESILIGIRTMIDFLKSRSN